MHYFMNYAKEYLGKYLEQATPAYVVDVQHDYEQKFSGELWKTRRTHVTICDEPNRDEIFDIDGNFLKDAANVKSFKHVVQHALRG